ncbi:glycosyltransferase family 4 protein [Porphyromonadaceae sp. NP-X]|nr:glycosyltransferase family 4 protein [Porphyromonadaceae sp. NP-X]
MSKPNILVIPAWYPAIFFQQQMELVEDFFNFKIIVGKRITVGRRKGLNKWFSKKYFEFKKKENYYEATYYYLNHLPENLNSIQIERLTSCFDKLINIIYQNEKPSLIHIQSLSDTAVFVCNWAKINKIPVILTEHILYIRHQFDNFQKLKEKVYEKADRVLCVSNYLYRNLLTSGIQLKNVKIIGNFIDDGFVKNNFNTEKPNNKILYIASHFEDKNFDLLLEVTKLLKEREINFSIDIIGLPADIPYKNGNPLFQTIKAADLSEIINIIGPIKHEDLLKQYQNYSFLVSTSISETFGLAIAEAIAYGLPVVCTDSGGIHDFVNETNGLIVPIQDAMSLAVIIENFVHGQYQFNKLEISKNIRKKYGRNTFLKILSTEYWNLIKNE